MFILLSIVERRFLHISMRDWTDKDPPCKNIQQKNGCFQERSWGYQKTKFMTLENSVDYFHNLLFNSLQNDWYFVWMYLNVNMFIIENIKMVNNNICNVCSEIYLWRKIRFTSVVLRRLLCKARDLPLLLYVATISSNKKSSKHRTNLWPSNWINV